MNSERTAGVCECATEETLATVTWSGGVMLWQSPPFERAPDVILAVGGAPDKLCPDSAELVFRLEPVLISLIGVDGSTVKGRSFRMRTCGGHDAYVLVCGSCGKMETVPTNQKARIGLCCSRCKAEVATEGWCPTWHSYGACPGCEAVVESELSMEEAKQVAKRRAEKAAALGRV